MRRRRIYDWQLDEEVARLHELAGEDAAARAKAWFDVAKADGLHIGVALGIGDHVCPTCAVLWPCTLSPHR